MAINFSRSRVIGGWAASWAVIVAAGIALGVKATTVALLLALGIVPAIVALLIGRAAAPSIADMLRSADTKDGPS